MPTLETEMKLWQQTGNSTHARWIATELAKVIGKGRFASIEKYPDVVVGVGSGCGIESGLLWDVVECVEENSLNHRRQNVIMKEALMQIRNGHRRWPHAGDIAKNALDRAQINADEVDA